MQTKKDCWNVVIPQGRFLQQCSFNYLMEKLCQSPLFQTQLLLRQQKERKIHFKMIIIKLIPPILGLNLNCCPTKFMISIFCMVTFSIQNEGKKWVTFPRIVYSTSLRWYIFTFSHRWVSPAVDRTEGQWWSRSTCQPFSSVSADSLQLERRTGLWCRKQWHHYSYV